MSPLNENKRKDGAEDDDPNKSSSSWFGSWFERDMRNDIHEKLNAFDERKKQYEEEQKGRRRLFDQDTSSSSFPFPFFFPPESDNSINSKNPNHGDEQKDDFEDFLGGRIPRPNWEKEFDGENEDRRFGGSPFEKSARENHQREQQSIEDLHREMESLFKAAFAGGTMQPSQSASHSGSRGWTSSSTVVSSSNGSSYTMKQDSKNGARVDLKLPRHCQSENVSLEVIGDRPCLVRWRNNDENARNVKNGKDHQSLHRRANNGQVFELGNSVDCSRLSASISEAHRTLTVKAPPRGGGEDEEPLSLKANAYPRPVRVAKKQ